VDIEHTMRFILDKQAKLEANAGLQDERLARIEIGLAELSNSVAQIGDSVVRLGNSIITVNDLVGRLAQAGQRAPRRWRARGKRPL